MSDPIGHLIDSQAKVLANCLHWLPLDLPGDLANLEWPVAVLGEGPPLLMLHGFDSSFLEFRRLAPLLTKENQLWIPDLCGFGFCPRPLNVNYNPELVLTHLEALIAQIQLKQPNAPLGVIGASMGGAVAVALSKRLENRNPGWLNRMLLLAPAGINGKPMPLPPLLDKLGVAFLRLPAVRKGLCRQAFANPNNSVGPGEEEIASLHLKTPGWSKALASFARSGGFAGVGTPPSAISLQVLWGANDRILVAKQQKAAAALLGDYCMELANCGHLPHLDQPALVADHWQNLHPTAQR
jgi:pimeloyl-ACP methyl ester carboxylesterase